MKITTQDYGQFLINGVNNFTATHFSEIVEGLKHDSVSRYLNGSKISSKAVWERVENEIIYIRYDDTNMKYVYLCCNCDTVWKN